MIQADLGRMLHKAHCLELPRLALLPERLPWACALKVHACWTASRSKGSVVGKDESKG